MDDDWGDCSSNLRTPPDYTTVDLSLPTYEDAIRQGAGGTTTIIDVSKPESDEEILSTSTQQIEDVSWRNRYTSEPVTQSWGQDEVQLVDVTNDIRQSQKDIKCCMITCLIIILLIVGMIGSQYFDK